MNPNTPTQQEGRMTKPARQLLLAARTAVSLLENMHSLMWDLYAEEILDITQHDQQAIVEVLAMAMVDEAWPHDADDNYENNPQDWEVVSKAG